MLSPEASNARILVTLYPGERGAHCELCVYWGACSPQESHSSGTWTQAVSAPRHICILSPDQSPSTAGQLLCLVVKGSQFCATLLQLCCGLRGQMVMSSSWLPISSLPPGPALLLLTLGALGGPGSPKAAPPLPSAPPP